MNNEHNTSDRLSQVIATLENTERLETEWAFEQARLLWEAQAALEALRQSLIAEAEATHLRK
jgi:hypothetical protein